MQDQALVVAKSEDCSIRKSPTCFEEDLSKIDIVIGTFHRWSAAASRQAPIPMNPAHRANVDTMRLLQTANAL